ncbi:MAG: menaquinone biosynthetic enzyme MqnA/MqnD family protein [bacterium]
MVERREEEGILLQIGKIPYLNCVPFFRGLTLRPHWKLVEGSPSRIGDLVRDWRLDAAPVPSAVYLDYNVQQEYGLLGDLGIAVRKRVGSVCLFSKIPIEKLNAKQVHLTGESNTSAKLLKLLLAKRFGVTPDYTTEKPESADAQLLIGDEALRRYTDHERADGGHVYDLADLWHEWKSLPFVFAVWVIKTGVADDLRTFIEKKLRASWLDTMQNLDTLAPELSEMYKLAVPVVVDYLTNFQYHIGKEEHRALHEFARELGSFEGTPVADAR